jgi:hypothetical protein
MAAAEIVRRMVWGFLRLEWEHIEKYGSAPVSPEQVKALQYERARMELMSPVKVLPYTFHLLTLF